ncbi:MAG TPA: NAD-dependent epimerase/dehydratase family protein [Chitinophagaceae bacterium]|nr:NAD-dependent epimerase/dehydratase family protein [Chitinophagaceae bacterium]
MVLVTGGTGFIGAYIIQELIHKGYAVRAIRRSNKLPFFISPDILDKVEWVSGDVLDVIALDEAMQGVDRVIHSAASVSFVKSERAQMYNTNVDGTANIVNLALENGIRKLVHISSISALGRTFTGEHVNEEKKWVTSKFDSHYGISKNKAEMEVWRAIGEGLDAVIINPSTVLGFGNWHDSSCAIFRNLYKGFRWYTRGINGFVCVEDVAKIAVLLMESDISGERFIINHENWEFKKLFDSITGAFGKTHPSWEATPLLSHIAWRFEKMRSLIKGDKPLITKETTRIALSKTYWQNDKILAALPDFSFVPLEQCITNACKKYADAVNNMQLKP